MSTASLARGTPAYPPALTSFAFKIWLCGTFCQCFRALSCLLLVRSTAMQTTLCSLLRPPIAFVTPFVRHSQEFFAACKKPLSPSEHVNLCTVVLMRSPRLPERTRCTAEQVTLQCMVSCRQLTAEEQDNTFLTQGEKSFCPMSSCLAPSPAILTRGIVDSVTRLCTTQSVYILHSLA